MVATAKNVCEDYALRRCEAVMRAEWCVSSNTARMGDRNCNLIPVFSGT
jgi:hypothetical protein